MFFLYTLTLLASIPALLIGLIDPKLVIPKKLCQNPTRKFSTTVYSGIAIASFVLGVASIGGDDTAATTAPAVAPPAPTVTVKTTASKPVQPPTTWRSHLPNENQKLRAFLAEDPALDTWLRLKDVWVGYADLEDLQKRGFFINAQLKHNGLGASVDGLQHGSCSLLASHSGNAPIICGVGAFDSPSWGIQEDVAIAAIRSRMDAIPLETAE